MNRIVQIITLTIMMSQAAFAQVFDSITEISSDYNIQDIAKKGDILFAALGEGGVWYSEDDGFTWNQTSAFPDAGFGQEAAMSLLIASNGDIIVGGNQLWNGAALGGSVFRSLDNGATWNGTTYEGLGGYEESGKIVELSNGDLMMQAGIDKIFASSLSSNEWTQTNAPGGVIFGFENINDVVFVVTNPAGGNAGTWVTSDLGQTWTRYGGNGTPVSGGTVTIAPILKSSEYKFIGIGGSYEPRGLYRSGINDTLWVDVNNGLNTFGIYPTCMATDNQTIWMVFQEASGGCNFTSSTDFGDNWAEPVQGLPQQAGSAPCLSKLLPFKTDLYTFANKSIYRLEDVVSPNSVSHPKQNNIDFKVYPNPNTGRFNIAISTANKEAVTITVFNMTGSIIHTEEPGILSQGNHQIPIQLNNLPTGIYIVTVQSASGIGTQRIEILR
ncbi:MAG: T9SS type A sorting domain-containing protein [Bacteroidales bacterium]|nr:T9SS type A sorting domain-containing protein [Bacteroidales bacterium]